MSTDTLKSILESQLATAERLATPYTKAEQDALAAVIVQDALDGEASAVARYVELKALEETLKLAKSKLEDAAIEEAYSYPLHGGEHHGVEFAYKQGSKRYTFDHDDDYAKLKAAVKAREKLMKQAAESGDTSMVDNETGEVIPAAEVSTTKDSLVVKFPKS